jgi:hypothetical protein
VSAEEALLTAAGLLAVTAARLQNALPALGRVIADVESDWLDDAGRAWVERAGLVQRELDREADAALAAGRLVASAMERLVAMPDGRPPDDQSPDGLLPDGRAADGRTSEGRPPDVSPGDGAVVARRSGTGPRLGGTDARRVDDERGMNLARLSDDGP